AGDPRIAGGLSRDAAAAAGRRPDRTRDFATNRTDAGQRAREPASRHGDAARGAVDRPWRRWRMNPPGDHPRDDEYLWDRSGEIEADVAELERLLAPLRWQDGVRRGEGTSVPMRRHRAHHSRWSRVLATAAGFALVAAGLYGWHVHRLAWPEARAWQVAGLESQVRVDGVALASLDALPPGALLETGEAPVRLRAA